MNQRTWLITGVSSGLGKALAEAVIESGDYVVGTLRSHTEVLKFNETYADKATAIKLDVTDFNAIEQEIALLKKKSIQVDVLVNNAGVGFVGAIEETSIEETRKVFEANLFGTLKMTQVILPLMRAQKSGHIIQISSHAGVKAFAGFGIYNASKFALEGYSEALAAEVKPLGISVTIVEPGPFRTSFAGSSLGIASKVIDDYHATAGAFKTKLLGANGKQEGHPAKAALAIIQHINHPNGSLRLPLGKLPIATIGMKVKSIIEDLEMNREISESAVY